MKQGRINIYGDIYPDDTDFASDFGIISLSTVADEIEKNKDADELIVHIRSRGGDVTEGFAIYDALVGSGKKITTVIEGLCASIATVVAFAGSTRKMMAHSDYLIHYPWGDPFSMPGFTADDYAQRAEEIRVKEDQLVAFYKDQTGIDEKSLRSMMKKETTLTPDQALEMKFVTEIVDDVKAYMKGRVHAIALLKPIKNNTQMSKEKSSLLTRLDNAISAFKKAINALSGLTLNTTDGKSLQIDQEGDILIKGSKVNIDHQPAPDGEYAIASTGQTITVKGGAIEDIKTPEDTTVDATVLAAKDKEIADLKKERDELLAEQSTVSAKMEEFTALAAKLKVATSKEFIPGRNEAARNSTQGTKADTPEARADAAITRLAEKREKEALAKQKA